MRRSRGDGISVEVKVGWNVDGAPTTSICATARPDNPGSYKILDRLGFKNLGEDVVHDGLRRRYLLEFSASSKAFANATPSA